jgi:hypothetical protein
MFISYLEGFDREKLYNDQWIKFAVKQLFYVNQSALIPLKYT